MQILIKNLMQIIKLKNLILDTVTHWYRNNSIILSFEFKELNGYTLSPFLNTCLFKFFHIFQIYYASNKQMIFKHKKTRFKYPNKIDKYSYNNHARCNSFLFVCCCNLNDENTIQVNSEPNRIK